MFVAKFSRTYNCVPQWPSQLALRERGRGSMCVVCMLEVLTMWRGDAMNNHTGVVLYVANK